MSLRDAIARALSCIALIALVCAAAAPAPAAAQDGAPDPLVAAIAAQGAALADRPAALADVAAAPAPELAAAFAVYLPSLSKPGAQQQPTTPPTKPTTPPATPTTPAAGALFLSEQVKTLSSVAKVDAQGRIHVVLSTFLSYSENPQAFYGFCKSLVASQCLTEDSWSFVALLDQVDGVELDLTGDGRPRVVIRQKNANNTTTNYIYGECDSACDKGESWHGALVVNSAENQLFAADAPQRSFALDPQGRPRFIFGNGWGNGQPDGIFYMSCESDCAADGANWTKTSMYEGPEYKTLGINYPSLAFTSDGRPRAVGMMTLTSTDTALLYFECDAACDQQSSWATLDLGAGYASWDVEVDRQDRVHVALNRKITLDPLPADGHVEYRTCDEGCASEGSWTGGELPLQGQYADLELDAQGRPRMAYGALNASGVAFAWCDTGCTAGAGWRSKMVDTASKMLQDFPVAHPFTCEPTAWMQFTPSLALDRDGNPRIAADALNGSKCWYDNNPNDNIPPQSKIEKMYRAVRFIVATK